MFISSPFAPVPVTNVLVQDNILLALQKHAELHPTRPALVSAVDPSVRITYEQLRTQTFAVASFLSKHGVGYRDAVCLVLPNGIEYVVSYLASLTCGAVKSGASAMFTDYELERQFLDSQCKAVITDKDNIEKVVKSLKNCPLIKVVLCVSGGVDLPTNVYSWEEAVETAPKEIPPFPKIVDDVAILPYSSGTTGSPKGVMLTHKNFGTMVHILLDYFNVSVIPKLKGGDRWDWYKQNLLLMLPFYHQFGFTLLNVGLLSGATGVIMTKFDPHVFLRSLQNYKVELLMVAPPTVLMMCRHGCVADYDLSSLQAVLSSAAPLGNELCDEFYKKFGNVRFIAQAYGITEGSMIALLLDCKDRNNYLTVGHVVANLEQKMIDPSTGASLPRGQRGELCVRGPTVMKGYLNRPDATAETIDKEDWLHTGDVGYIDDKGQTFIVDRIKELIKVKGLQVPPAELEDLLHGHPDVHDVAVVGIPDVKVGERPKAFIVRANEQLAEKDVQKFVASKVSAYKWLTGGVEFVQEIPKSPSGKILRRLLREKEAWSKL